MRVATRAITAPTRGPSSPTSASLPTWPQLERRIAKPLGITFWLLSVVTLFLGLGNYITTVNKYGQKAAIVQTGWRTQLVLALLAFCIIGTCAVLLIIERLHP
ncbi:hypothetical protein XA68_13728 [Ophiocordyceps unilateralis]|uniref:DUF202 domain-containing protein n=1 Tax=Ophiocordyceps unilateralis TaxID=268505 RepID=A0A2A9PBT3_OPHUN|nr:hypothetical protein XA68_13728 [Ophiocordyceps unilateralis]